MLFEREIHKMNFVEYLKKIKQKYGISNTEMLEELNKNNLSMGKSALSHKLNGERPIDKKEFDIILRVLGLTVSEELKLKSLYKIHCIGEKKYEEIQCMKEFVELFNEEVVPYIPQQKTHVGDTIRIDNNQMMNSVLYTVMNEVWGKSKIRVLCQPEYRTLSDILISLAIQKGKADIEQIVCFNNSEKRETNEYNIRNIKTLCNIVMRNNNHKIRYYYDDIQSHINEFSLFPFMVISDKYVTLITSDFESGYCFHDNQLAEYLSARFNDLYNKSQPLFEEIHNDLEYLKVSMEMEQSTYKEFYTLQFHPCVLFEGNLEYAQRKIKDSFPYKEEMIELYMKRISYSNQYKSYHIYSQDGMEDFLATGRTLDLSEALFHPLDIEERKAIVEHLKNASQNKNGYAISGNALKIPKILTIACYDNGNIIIGYKNPDFAGYQWIIKERSMWKSMMTFLKYLCSGWEC